VKEENYPTPFWLHPDKEKGEWGDSLPVTYIKLNFTTRCMPPQSSLHSPK